MTSEIFIRQDQVRMKKYVIPPTPITIGTSLIKRTRSSKVVRARPLFPCPSLMKLNPAKFKAHKKGTFRKLKYDPVGAERMQRVTMTRHDRFCTRLCTEFAFHQWMGNGDV